MEKDTRCEILQQGIKARKQYIDVWHWIAGGAAIAIIGIYIPPILVVAIILMLIGLFINAMAFFSHLDVLKLIKAQSPYDPYTPVLLAIALQIAIGMVSFTIVASSGNWEEVPLSANLLSAITNFIIFITLYRQMYIHIEKALGISLSLAYTIGIFETLLESLNMLISKSGINLIIGIFILLVMYFQLSAFLDAYQDAWKQQCLNGDNNSPTPHNTDKPY